MIKRRWRRRRRGIVFTALPRALHAAFLALPWWAGPPLAALGGWAAAGGVPVVLREAARAAARRDWMPLASELGRAVEPAAAWGWLVAPGLLLFWLGSLWTRARRGRRVRRQKNLQTVRALDWREFEKLCAEVFRREGHAVELTAEGADGGVDLVLRRRGRVRFVQCKQWRSERVGVSLVRELWGVVAAEKAAGGVFVTSGGYTAEARRFAAPLKELRLVDGPGLVQMIRASRRGRGRRRA